MPDRYDPLTAEQARPIIAGVLFTALCDPEADGLDRRALALYLAGRLAARMTHGEIDACDRVRNAMTKATWGVDSIDQTFDGEDAA